jgi:hypothetical protein
MTGMHLDPVIGYLLLAAFTILFGSAALHKWRHLARFDEVFTAYALVPGSWRRAARLVPTLETLVAAGLLPAATRAYAGTGGVLLLLCYASAMALNLQRGRRHIACGCGGPDDSRSIASFMIWRNLLLALLLGGALAPWTTRALTPTDWLTAVFGVAAAVTVYLCADRLGQVAQQVRLLRAAP